MSLLKNILTAAVLVLLSGTAACNLKTQDQESMNARTRMLYNLSAIETKYEGKLPIVKDTVIFEVVDYYRKWGPDSLLARALEMQGAVYFERDEPIRALESYKDAIQALQHTENTEQLGSLYYQIGTLYELIVVDKIQAAKKYRKAIMYFNIDAPSPKSTRPYLSLARVLLPDSTDAALKYINAGIMSATKYNDTASLTEGMFLTAKYWQDKGEYEKAVQVSTDALNDKSLDSPYVRYNFRNQFLGTAATGYTEMNYPDSAELMLQEMTLNSTNDSIIYFRTREILARKSGNWRDAVESHDTYNILKNNIKKKGEQVDIAEAEQSYSAMLAETEYKNQKRTMVIMLLASTLCLVSVFALVVVVFMRKLKKQNKVVDYMMRELSETADTVFDAYVNVRNPENFHLKFSSLIDNFFKKKNPKQLTSEIIEVLYPGYVTYLRKQFPSLTDNDLFIISMLLCNFSTKSMTVLYGHNENAIYTAKTRISKKLGADKPLSEYLNEHLLSYTKLSRIRRKLF